MKFGIGQSAARIEDARFLRGAGNYLDDLDLPGAGRAFVLRSPVAHATGLTVDAEAARAAPGVRLVYTGADVAGRLKPLANEFPLVQTDGAAPAPATLPHLAEGKLLFVGQPVAFIVADTLDQARDAAERIEVDFDELAPVVSSEAALEPGAPQLHAEAQGNLAYDWSIGDAAATDAAFAAAAHVVRTRVTCQRIVVASMEARAIAASYAAETGRWEVWSSTQGAHGMRDKIADALDVEKDRVRVRVPDVGGGFGMKLMRHPEYGLAALAARDLDAPVRWTGDRSESFLSDAQGREMIADAEGAFDAEGRILALRCDAISALGASYSSFGAAIHTVFSAPIFGGMYRVPTLRYRTRGAFTNTTPTDAYRGAGRPEVIYVTERVMEAAARQMGMDPVALRRLNLLTPEELPHETPGGFSYDSLDPAKNIDDAVAAADLAGFPARRAEAEARGALRGIALAYYMERTGGGPLEMATVTLTPEGRARIAVGTQSTGQGHATAWAQIVAEKLGLPAEAFELADGDSDALPYGGGTGGSRSAKMASQVLLTASDDVIAKARAAAAERFETAEADIEFSPAEGGVLRVAGTDRAVGLAALAADIGGLAGLGEMDGRESTFPNGAHVAEVEIDPETGALRLVAYTVVDDFGVLLNPLLVAGQVHGGVAQGAGQVLGEAMVWDPETGQPLTGSFMDYAMPRAADLPNLPFAFNEVPARTNPLGLKGCGEAGCCGAIAAIALAARDALTSGGGALIETPFTPERVWSALSGEPA